MLPINISLESASSGLRFETVSDKTLKNMTQLNKYTFFENAIRLLQILNELDHLSDYIFLASPTFMNTFHKTENKILDNIADLAHMNSSSFSRYFKQVHYKTFTRYVNEVRNGFACKQLLKHRKSITATCYESGFNNLSNFN